jgi:hypothetical protein
VSPVRTGTRLEQLESLERRTHHELDSARRRGDRGDVVRLDLLLERLEVEIRAEGGPTTKAGAENRDTRSRKRYGTPRTRHEKAEDRVSQHLARLGVTAREVKVWAVAEGLIPGPVKRGRVKGALVTAYELAHPIGGGL